MKSILEYFTNDISNCLIIAEVAQTHEGSLGQAHAFIDAVADAGADAIKFQTHIADAESTPSEPFRVHFSKQDANRFEYWKRMEFSEEQWGGLAEHAKDRGILFLSSPFSIEAVELLERVGVTAWKLGSGEVTNWLLLDKIISTGKPVMISSGMSLWEEIERYVTYLRQHKCLFALIQSTTMYPTPPENIGLNILTDYKKGFCCPVGLSDHSGTIFPSLAAVTLGARFVEIHVTMSRYMFGPDVSSSITIDELSQLVKGVRFLEKALANPVDKDLIADNLSSVRKIFHKSVVPKVNLPAGKVLEPGDLTIKKPGIGIPSDLLHTLYGKRLKKALSVNDFFSLEDVEEDN